MPVQIAVSGWTSVRRAFEKAEYKLTDEVAPSKPYFDRKLIELDSEFVAEPLTSVTSTRQEEDSQHKVPQIDPITGFFRVATKTLGSDEECRLR